MGSLAAQGKERFGVEPQAQLPIRAIPNFSITVSPLLPPSEYKRAIPPFTDLLWFLFTIAIATNVQK